MDGKATGYWRNRSGKAHMPDELTQREQEYMKFIRGYIHDNQSAPRLDEIAGHFYVTSPTAHKVLGSLQEKGYLYFGRTKYAGFFIRLIEHHGSSEPMIEIPIVGKVNRYGELHEFPRLHGQLATLLLASQPGRVYAISMAGDIPQENLLAHDVIIFEEGVTPYPEDICIAPIGEKQYLIQIVDVIPSSAANGEPYFTWRPIAYDSNMHDYFMDLVQEQDWELDTIPESFIIATALRLSRRLAY
jgi:SOS-response transcriptional repressor LexA